jgi:hypothetical protein
MNNDTQTQIFVQFFLVVFRTSLICFEVKKSLLKYELMRINLLNKYCRLFSGVHMCSFGIY